VKLLNNEIHNKMHRCHGICGTINTILKQINSDTKLKFRKVVEVSTLLYWSGKVDEIWIISANRYPRLEKITKRKKYTEATEHLYGTWKNRWLTDWLTPWSSILLEKLIVTQLLKKFLPFYATRRFITVFTTGSLIATGVWLASRVHVCMHPGKWLCG
jgi:hypothetical protein